MGRKEAIEALGRAGAAIDANRGERSKNDAQVRRETEQALNRTRDVLINNSLGAYDGTKKIINPAGSPIKTGFEINSALPTYRPSGVSAAGADNPLYRTAVRETDKLIKNAEMENAIQTVDVSGIANDEYRKKVQEYLYRNRKSMPSLEFKKGGSHQLDWRELMEQGRDDIAFERALGTEPTPVNVTKENAFGFDLRAGFAEAESGLLKSGQFIKNLADKASGALYNGAVSVYDNILNIDRNTEINRPEPVRDFLKETGEYVSNPNIKDPLDRLFERGIKYSKNISEDALQREEISGLNPTVGKFTRMTAAAIPQAVAAYVTGGKSLATEGGWISANAGNTAVNIVKNLTKNPQFWLSWFSMAGTDYEEAISSGMNDKQATAFAIINSALNASIEVGSGLEKLVQETGTGSVRQAVWDWVKSLSEEGLEEVTQGAVSSTNKAWFKGESPEVFSFENEDAVINPKRMAEEYAGGAVVGGILGSPALIANSTYANSQRNTKDKSVYMAELTDDELFENKTAEEIKREYVSSTDEKMFEFIENSRVNKFDNKSSFKMSRVSERAAADIKKVTNIDVAGYTHNMKANTIRHIMDGHGINGKTDNSMSDDRDIARMQYVLDNYDKIERLPELSREYRDKNSQPVPMVKYQKRINGTYYVVEAVPDTKKKQLEIVTAYKKEANQQTRNANNLLSDVRNASAVNASDDNISQNNKTVNQNFEEGVSEEVRSFGENLGESGRKFFYARYEKAADFDTYKEAFSRFYRSGEVGLDFDKMYKTTSGELKAVMPEQYAKIVYELGQKDAQADTDNIKNERTGAVIFDEKKSGFVNNKYTVFVNEDFKEAAGEVSKQLGIRTGIVPEGSIAGGAAAGSYADGRIKLEEDGEVKTFGHEVGHRIKELAPEEYSSITQYVFNDLEKQGISADKYIDDYRRILENNGLKKSDSEIIEEAVNDYIGKIINTPSKLQELIDNAKNGKLDTNKTVDENLTILQTFIKAIKEFVEKIKNALKMGKISKSEADKNISSAEKAMELIQNAYNAATEYAEAHRGQNESRSGKGEKYSIAGKKAKDANISKLSEAEELEINGETAESIYQKTGWYRGMDGEWKFEISDFESNLVESPKLERHINDGDEYFTGKLPDILRHDALFVNYPILRNTDIIIQETDVGVGGSAFTKSNQIVLNKRLFERKTEAYSDLLRNRQKYIDEIENTPEFKKYNSIYEDDTLEPTEWLNREKELRDEFFSSELGKKYYELKWGNDKTMKKYELGWADGAKSVLVHEIQHIIQGVEGFAAGSSPSTWYKKLEDRYRKNYSKKHTEFLRLYDNASSDTKKALDFLLEKASSFNSTREDVSKAYDEAAEFFDDEEKLEVLWEFEKAAKELKDFYENGKSKASAMYQKTAGEIEARDVSERMDYTNEERKKYMPRVDKDAVFSDGEISYFSAESENSKSIKEQLRENSDILSKMEIVAKIQYNNSNSTKVQVLKRTSEKFKKLGYSVERKGFGKIEVSEKLINVGLKYLNSEAEYAAFDIIDKVLKNGIEIKEKVNHKGRNYGTITFAAPVEINGLRGNVAVVVKETKGHRYKMHRILTPDGSVFELNEKSEATTDRMTDKKISESRSITSDNDNISQKSDIVNSNSMQSSEKYSLRDTAAYAEENARLNKKVESLQKKLEKANRLITPDMEAIKKFAKDIKKEYYSEITDEELYSLISGLKEKIKNTADGKLSFNELLQYSNKIAREVIEQSRQLSSDLRLDYKEMINRIKTVRFLVDDTVKAEFGSDWSDFRKRNQLRIGFTFDKSKATLGIDEFYRELEWQYPEYFDGLKQRSGKERLERIADVLDSLKPIYENKFAGYMDEASQWLGASILESLYDKTYFDIKKARNGKLDVEYDLEAVQEEANSVIQSIMQRQADWEERQTKQIEKRYSEKTERAIEKLRESKEKFIASEGEKFRERLESREARKKKAERAKQIRLHFERMQKRVLKPNDKNPVPEDIRGPISEFLNSFDIRSDRMGVATSAYFGGIYEKLQLIAQGKSGTNADYSLIIDDETLGNLKEVSGKLNDYIRKTHKAGGRLRISDLDLETLNLVYRTFLGLEQSLRNYGRMMSDGRWQLISTAAKKAIEENRTDKAYECLTGLEWGRNLFNFHMLNPYDFMHGLGETFEGLYKDIRRGFNRKIYNIAKAKDYMEMCLDGLKIKELSGDKVEKMRFEITLEGDLDYLPADRIEKKTAILELTPAQAMGFYLLSKQEQAIKHISTGGVVLPPEVKRISIKSNAKDGNENKIEHETVESIEKINSGAVKISLDQIEKIRQQIKKERPELIETADLIGRFFTRECASWGNDVSLQLYGYKKFMTKNYYPIVSSKNYIPQVYGAVNDKTLINTGIAQDRTPGASNPIVIEDIFDVYARHVDKMSSYNAFVIPIQNLQNVLNYYDRDAGESVRSVLAAKYGKKAEQYLSQFITDLNGGGKFEPGGSEVMNKLISNHKQASMGLNMRVVIQQPFSYIRAATEIDAKYLINAAAKRVNPAVKKTSLDVIYRYAPIALWKSWGFFSTDTSRSLLKIMTGQTDMSDKTMWLAGKADEETWKTIWAACELEVKDKHPEIRSGTSEFYHMVGERFSEIIDETQTVDSVLHRSHMQRSSNELVKMEVSYMSEPIKTYNLLRTALVDYTRNKTKESRRKLQRTVGVCVLQSLLMHIATGFYDALDDDEEDKKFIEQWATNSTWNVIGDFFGMIPYVKDVYSIVQGYNVKRMDMESITRVVQTIPILWNEKYTHLKKGAELTSVAAEFFGVPAGKLRRDLVSVLGKNLVRAGKGNVFEYWLLKQVFDIKSDKAKGEFLDVLYRAYKSGDEEDYDKIVADMVKNGISYSDIEKGLASRWRKSDKKGMAPESFSTTFENVTDLLPEEETEEDEGFTVDSLRPEQLKGYSTAFKEKYNKISDLLSKYEFESNMLKNKAIEKAEKYSKEIALREASNGEYVIGQKTVDGETTDSETWVEAAEKAPKTLNVSEAEFIYLTVKYKNSTATLTSEIMAKAVKERIKPEEYLKFYEAVKSADKELKKVRDEAKAEGRTIRQSKNLKIRKYREYIKDVDLPEAKKEEIMKFYIKNM